MDSITFSHQGAIEGVPGLLNADHHSLRNTTGKLMAFEPKIPSGREHSHATTESAKGAQIQCQDVLALTPLDHIHHAIRRLCSEPQLPALTKRHHH